jgi:phage terminase large subunit
MLEGAVYANELRQMELDNRLCSVPYDRSSSVDVFFDLGHADSTTMWFRQYIQFQHRYINYYEANQKHIDHYLGVMQRLGYTYGTIWLPHDAKSHHVGTKLTVEEQVRAKGYRVRLVPNIGLANGILAARTIFPNAWFDANACQAGLECLQHYRYDKNENTGSLSEKPVHDQYSHGADAFRYSAVGSKAPKDTSQAIPQSAIASAALKTVKQFAKNTAYGATGWMR